MIKRYDQQFDVAKYDKPWILEDRGDIEDVELEEPNH